MSHELSRYSCIIFDCDGVVLNSNRIKTEAFRTAAMPYGESAAGALVEHHVANGGVSRYIKFDHFLNTIVPEHAPDCEGPGLEELLNAYAQAVLTGLTSCSVARGLSALRDATRSARWFIVSGGDQSELREIFKIRGISDYFDGGIFGSPDAKTEILSRELDNGSIQRPALFLGDSRYDHEAALSVELDFIFVSCWSEFRDLRTYATRHQLPIVQELADFLQG